MLGIRAVIAESYERIHRSNLVGMGVIPLQFLDGEGSESLGLDGTEIFSVADLTDAVRPNQILTVLAVAADGSEKTFQVKSRLDSKIEIDYYRNGGILQYVLRQFLAKA